MLSGYNGLLTRAGEAKERTVTAQEEESAKLTFTEVQMELTQGKTVDNDKFQSMIDGNFGSNKATGTIGGNTYIITVARTGINYQMDSSGNIGTLAELPIDFNPGELEKSGDTYTINSIEDLVAFSYNVNSGTELYEGKTVTLGRNLDFQNDNSYVEAGAKYKKDDNGYVPVSSAENTIKELMTGESGVGFIPIGNDTSSDNTFKCNFDGKEKQLKNLYVNSSTFGGLFGNVSKDIEILNLSITSCNIIGNAPTGGIVGWSTATNLKLNNCHSSGNITSKNNTSGIIGGTMSGTINVINSSNYCTITGKISGSSGGIVGNASQGTVNVINCYNSGIIIGGTGFIGGIVGGTKNGMINNCYNIKDISGASTTGGILGYSTEPIEVKNCYNLGIVKSDNGVAGGIVGGNSGTITNCYNFGNITGQTVVGGILGNGSGKIDYTYNIGDVEVKSSSPVGGIASAGATITNSHNTGTITGLEASIVGEILGYGSVDDTNDYLKKTSGNANGNGAREEDKEETMAEIMSIQNFVTLMNSYVAENNKETSNTKLKTWKLENDLPVFAEE